MILAFKISRRLVASVGLKAETFSMADSRYLGPRDSLPRLVPYFRRLIEQASPRAIYVYAPGEKGASIEDLLRLLEVEAGRCGLSIHRLVRSDIFTAFGLLALPNRRELFATMQHIWPEIPRPPDERGIPLAEAAAAALVGDLREVWPPL